MSLKNLVEKVHQLNVRCGLAAPKNFIWINPEVIWWNKVTVVIVWYK